MSKFNKLYKSILETTTTAVFGATPGTYAPGDNRAFEPARMVIGAKGCKGKCKKNAKQQVEKVPIQRRPRVETVFLKGK